MKNALLIGYMLSDEQSVLFDYSELQVGRKKGVMLKLTGAFCVNCINKWSGFWIVRFLVIWYY